MKINGVGECNKNIDSFNEFEIIVNKNELLTIVAAIEKANLNWELINERVRELGGSYSYTSDLKSKFLTFVQE